MKHMHTLTLLLMLTDGATGAGGALPGPPAPEPLNEHDAADVASVLDLSGLAAAGVAWGVAVIAQAESAGGAGSAKLAQASTTLGEKLADGLNTIEERAGVLAALLNSPGVNAIEHDLVVKAVTFGGAQLAALLQQAVQHVFNILRDLGRI